MYEIDASGKKWERCDVCGDEIKVMIFKGRGVCCELCRKKQTGDRISQLESVLPG